MALFHLFHVPQMLTTTQESMVSSLATSHIDLKASALMTALKWSTSEGCSLSS